MLKVVAAHVIRFSLRFPIFNIVAVLLMVAVAAWSASRLDRDFLPPFNEGAIQLNVLLPPGNSLTTTISINKSVEQALVSNRDILNFVRRTGRAELDEHAEPVTASEYIIDLDPRSSRSREQQLDQIRKGLQEIPGIVFAVEQPISHLISHMLSGVKAQIGVKLYGDDLELLRRKAGEVKGRCAGKLGCIAATAGGVAKRGNGALGIRGLDFAVEWSQLDPARKDTTPHCHSVQYGRPRSRWRD